MTDGLAGLLGFAFLAFFIWMIVQLFQIVNDMAHDRNRDPLGWFLIALAWSPFAAIFILWLVGPRDRP